MYYGKPKNIIIFNNFKGIVSSKQPQTVTTIQNYYALLLEEEEISLSTASVLRPGQPPQHHAISLLTQPDS